MYVASGSKQRMIILMEEDSRLGTSPNITHGDRAPDRMSSTKLSRVSATRQTRFNGSYQYKRWEKAFLGGKYMRVTVETSFRVSLKKYIHQKSAVVIRFFTYFFLFYILYVYKKLFCNLKILLSTWSITIFIEHKMAIIWFLCSWYFIFIDIYLFCDYLLTCYEN